MPPAPLDIKYGSCDTSEEVPDDIQIIELSWSRQMTYTVTDIRVIVHLIANTNKSVVPFIHEEKRQLQSNES